VNNELLGIPGPPREGLRARLLLLRALPVCEGLDDEGLIGLAEHARSVSYREGDIITRAGEPARAIHVLVEGEMQLFQNERQVGVLKAGAAFGAFHVLARVPSVHAVASEFTRTIEVPAAAFETLLDENYSLLRSLLTIAGSAALAARGNLPVDPKAIRVIDEGEFYERPRSLVEQLIRIRSGSFAGMNVEALIDLARHMQEFRLPAGQLIWSAGDIADHSLHINYGRVRCTAPDGQHVLIGSDFTLGVLDVWGPRRRAYSVVSETPVILARVDFEHFLTLLESHVEVGLEILRGFARAIFESRALGSQETADAASAVALENRAPAPP
jgi:CRP-like cAMP-binding protein